MYITDQIVISVNRNEDKKYPRNCRYTFKKRIKNKILKDVANIEHVSVRHYGDNISPDPYEGQTIDPCILCVAYPYLIASSRDQRMPN